MKFAIFEDCLNSKQRNSYYFSEPFAEIIITEPAEFAAGLEQIEAYRVAGLYLAGYISYHASTAIYPPLTRIPPAHRTTPEQLTVTAEITTALVPLLHFVAYRKAEQFAAEDLLALLPELFPELSAELQAIASTSPARTLPATNSAVHTSTAVNFNYLELADDYASYSDKFTAVQHQLRLGNSYQLNLTLPLQLTTSQPSSAAYLYYQLSRSHPVSYAAYLPFNSAMVISISPELFFKKSSTQISVRPMKGTVPRGETPQQDQSLRDFLRLDGKNRAENLIIVDLLRNDLAKFCQTGSVEVSDLFAIEEYRSVFQMTSTIHGKIDRTTSFASIINALFPCGSITGAPKLRTMQLIDQLENYPRGIYTGALGYILPNNDMQFNVAIRTLSSSAEQLQQFKLGVGGGITIQSTAQDEWQEIITKLSFVRNFYHPDFKLIESFLVKTGKIVNLAQHLARLQSSAEKLIFKCDVEKISQLLYEYTQRNLGSAGNYKLRLELSYTGDLLVEHASLGENSSPLRVALAPFRIDTRHGLFCHKTTSSISRGCYTRIDNEYKPRSVDELIFINQDGIVTEARYHNLIINYAGKLITTPQSSGLLAGIFRAQLLADGIISEASISEQMFAAASEIYLCNDVRGMLRCNLVHVSANNVTHR